MIFAWEQRGAREAKVEARGVHAAIPAQDLLGGHPDPGERGVGGGAGGEDDVAGVVEGADGQRHRVGHVALARAQAGVGGELGVVAAHQRQAERAGESTPAIPAGPGEQTWIASKAPSASVCTAAGRLGTPIERPG